MAHQRIDGTLVVAKLKRNLWGAGVYADVTVRDAGGRHRNLGTQLVLDDMRHAMVPGRSGRFYFYDTMGSKGVHGFRPASGAAHVHFPRRWSMITIGLGTLNLLTVLAWLMLDGSLALLPLTLSVLFLAAGALTLQARYSALRAYAADEPGIGTSCFDARPANS